jgi:hypothetical protein
MKNNNKSESYRLPRKDNKRKNRILQTIFLALIWVSMGFNIEIFGPALEDIRILFNIDYKKFSILLITRTIGNIIATFLAGVTLSRLLDHSTLVLIIAKLAFIIRNTQLFYSLYIA